MEKSDVKKLRSGVLCAAVLERAGFVVDPKESTKRAVKFRRGDEIIIVIHDGKGWFDPLSDAKGDVFRLVEHLESVRFVEALDHVADLFGFVFSEPVWTKALGRTRPDLSIHERWQSRRKPWRGSMTWRYLRDERRLPETVIGAAIRQDRLREGPRGSMWAAHTDETGAVTGWEERGPNWRGFATGGAKVLFRFGRDDAERFYVTEAAIDAMSLAAVEAMRPDSLYLSTGGGWAPATVAAIRRLAARNGALLVAATDNNDQGEVYARRLEAIAVEAGCGFERLRPAADDWNEDLRAMNEPEREKGRERKGRLPHARRPRQG
ncbi:DUF3991 domain-containing protein [Mesorhizobium sp. M2A.F.Ca.ET.037.01.1.1]|uniref:DUF3991 and toprim domain-containing protein n=1 Tax=Mesorhizobium sp. M2A.F.Ca.ET.037.01.1.1 TaxID=2496748 RepID=UPI000FCC5504|nr:DUF3991 and toprim domain-containing protein [Mesorhizobium sp. M2A.F.Ca.ET.037.01.1.1]RUX02779.1 DUF3991 domain-containing protein [Mesorhizobium sp. M2A.F.Ca.ET.037.01.1.1]